MADADGVNGEASLQQELDVLRAVLHNQVAAWLEVKKFASQMFANSRHHGGSNPGEFQFHQLLNQASEQSVKLQEAFEQITDGKTKGKENTQSSAARETYMRAECKRLLEEKADMTREIRELQTERELIIQKMQVFMTENERLAEQQNEMNSKWQEYHQERESLINEVNEHKMERDRLVNEVSDLASHNGHLRNEREDLVTKVTEQKADFERRLADDIRKMTEKQGEFYAECGRTVEANRAEMSRQMLEFQAERERFEQEKADMVRKINQVRQEGEAKMKKEEAELAKKMAKLHEECEKKVAEEMAAAERRVSEGRRHTDSLIQKERQVTDSIKHVLRELPPLQTAMELGDLALLEDELKKWKMDLLPEHFGECKGVVEAVLKLARERLVSWRGVEQTWKDVLREVEHLPTSLPALTRQSQRIFRTLKESQLTMLDLNRSDPEAMERTCEVLLAWQEREMAHSNHVQRLIVRKTVMWRQLGPFDFADLDICLRLVDREGSSAFLSRAEALVEDERTAPSQLRPLLSHLETMLFFLKYTMSEDLALTHIEFQKLARDADASVSEYLKWAESVYSPGCELVHGKEGQDLMDVGNVQNVLRDLRKSPSFFKKDGLGQFREIFYQWACAMHGTFNLLVLPHHTQVVCLLAFQRFMESTPAPHTLVAQVGTGEGKSMIIAALAIYVVTNLKKKVHVVVDDETLLDRDFGTFKRVFDAFEVPDETGNRRTRPLSAVLCVSEERLAASKGQPHMSTRVDPKADICYCEAKHVQSFYASIARGENMKTDFSSYNDRVLILDEVDALVIDEEPNDVFVYPNQELSKIASTMAGVLVQGIPLDSSAISQHPATKRVAIEMTKEWARGKKMSSGEDFIYSKELGKYCALHGGRANPKAWSLALECRNFQDGLSREILFQERLFVTSRPRVFRKYHRILGLSGSIGSKPEQAFLRDTYHASFFKVPPFLTTCRGAPFHEAVPVKLGSRQRMVYVENTHQEHLQRLAEIALDARDRVPVLIIARDRSHADQMVDGLRQVARSRGLGTFSEDIIRSLSRTLYEANPEQWKENLNRATLAVGNADGTRKSWRVTVTDPRGGRGTDYRVDDHAVDAQGGLLLIPTMVPTSRREWTQFLGRTARQDCKGQYCCVLNGADYKVLSAKYKETLLPNSADAGLSVIETILRWGDKEASERIQGSSALYNCGVRMNELCEMVFSQRPEILKDNVARERLVDACQRLRYLSMREVDDSFRRLPNFDPASVPTEASNFGRPEEPPANLAGSPLSKGGNLFGSSSQSSGGGAPKVVLFCLDWSASMQSRDTGTQLSRFETCVQCILRILRDQVRDSDSVGVICFGPNVQLVVPVMPKGKGGATLNQRIAALRPQMAGGTCFFDAMANCLQLLNQPSFTSAGARRWLVCLTDGDDAGSQSRNAKGEMVTQMLNSMASASFNLLAITVGPLKMINSTVINGWVSRVSNAGGIARLMAEKDSATIARAFDVVAEYLSVEVGGVVEC